MIVSGRRPPPCCGTGQQVIPRKDGEQACKPDSVPAGVPGAAIILLGAGLLPGSSDLPEGYPPPVIDRRCQPGLRSEPLLPSYLVLLRVGFALPRRSLSGRCALTLSPVPSEPHLFTLTPAGLRQLRGGKPPPRGGIFSVALSVPGKPLWNLPEKLDRPWPLASTLLCGVRTFLPASAFDAAGAIAQPTRLSTLSMMHQTIRCNSC